MLILNVEGYFGKRDIHVFGVYQDDFSTLMGEAKVVLLD